MRAIRSIALLAMTLCATAASAQSARMPTLAIAMTIRATDADRSDQSRQAPEFSLLELRRDGREPAVPPDDVIDPLAAMPGRFQSAGNPEAFVPPATAASAWRRIDVPPWMQARTGAFTVPAFLSARCEEPLYRPSGILAAGSELRRRAWYPLMATIACAHGLPVSLFDALIIAESGYDPGALSPKRASGLTQLMPATAAGLGVDRFDPVENLRGGARYLREQIDRFGAVHLALGAYNAGPARIRDQRLPAIRETRTYVDRILRYWRRLEQNAGSELPAAARDAPVGGPRIAAILSF